jgi:hypothetical protein
MWTTKGGRHQGGTGRVNFSHSDLKFSSSANPPISWQGDIGNHFYIIESGECKVTKIFKEAVAADNQTKNSEGQGQDGDASKIPKEESATLKTVTKQLAILKTGK